MLKAVLLNDTRYDLHHGGWVVTNTILNQLKKRRIAITRTCAVGKDWSRDKKVKEAIEGSDFVIVNGEGTIHHDQPSAINLVKVATYCKNLRKPVFLINSVFEGNTLRVIEHVKNFDLIFVRESKSYQELISCGLVGKIVPDLTFSTADKSAYKGRVGIGITDSVFKERSEEFLRFSIRHNIVFMPILMPYWLRWRNLRTFGSMIKFYTHSLKPYIVKDLPYEISRKKYYRPLDSYLKSVASKKFLFAGRFHAVCFAIKFKTPFVCILSNSHKMQGLIADVGLSLSRIVEAPILSQINEYQFTSDEIKKIEFFNMQATQKIELMFDEIIQFVQRA